MIVIIAVVFYFCTRAKHRLEGVGGQVMYFLHLKIIIFL